MSFVAANAPIATFQPAPVIAHVPSAPSPIATLLQLVVAAPSAFDPIAGLQAPVVKASNALNRGVPLDEIRSLSVVPEIIRSKYEIKDEELDKLDELHNKTIKTLKSLSTSEVSVTAK